MSKFGWTRLAQLTITLAVVALLVKLGSFGLDAARQDFLTSAARFVPEVTTEQTIPDKDPEDLVGNSKLRPEADANADEAAPAREHEQHEHDHKVTTQSVYENVNFSKEAPVFFRPKAKPQKDRRATDSASTVPSGSVARSSDGKVCKNISAAPKGAKIVFPLTRDNFDTYEDTWGAARTQGGHEGTDLMVDDGTPLLALTDATVVPVSGASPGGWNELGGYTVMLEANYSIGPVRKGDLFYYAHMNQRTKLSVGDRVKVGDVVGYAGDTGQGPEVTKGQFPSHLHLGWYDVSSGRSQLASGAMNPYPLLEWVKANGGSIEGGSDVPYCEAPQSSSPTPSGGGYWQFPTDPGVRPDMDTGNEQATPTPDAKPLPSAESSPNVEQEEEIEQTIVQEVVQDQDGNSGQAIREEQTNVEQEITDSTQSGEAGQAISQIPQGLDDIRDWIGSVVNPRPDRPDQPNQPESTRPDKPKPENSKPENSKPDSPKPDKPKPDDPKPGEPRPGKPDPDRPDSPKPDKPETDDSGSPESTIPDEGSPGNDACATEPDSDAEAGAADEQYRGEDGTPGEAEVACEDPESDQSEAPSPEEDQSGDAARRPFANEDAPEAVSDGTEATATETTSPR